MRSRAEIERIVRHLVVALDEPRFAIVDANAEGDQRFMSWDLRFRMKRFDRSPQHIRGCTPIRFSADGRIARTATTGTPPRSCTRSCRRSLD